MSAPDASDPIDDFLASRDPTGWETSYNKKQCPDCGALHGETASRCSVCGWAPAVE
ncbi:MAG: HVO_0416 family zinc finger protein [Halococcoides sp.]